MNDTLRKQLDDAKRAYLAAWTQQDNEAFIRCSKQLRDLLAQMHTTTEKADDNVEDRHEAVVDERDQT